MKVLSPIILRETIPARERLIIGADALTRSAIVLTEMATMLERSAKAASK